MQLHCLVVALALIIALSLLPRPAQPPPARTEKQWYGAAVDMFPTERLLRDLRERGFSRLAVPPVVAQEMQSLAPNASAPVAEHLARLIARRIAACTNSTVSSSASSQSAILTRAVGRRVRERVNGAAVALVACVHECHGPGAGWQFGPLHADAYGLYAVNGHAPLRLRPAHAHALFVRVE